MDAVAKKLEITTLNIKLEDENKLRFLALELAKGVLEPEELLEQLGWDEDDYNEISKSRIFRQMLRDYKTEWNGAGNTKKRVQLKSVVNIEAALSNFYAAMIDPNEPLMARVKTLEILGKLGGLGQSETVGMGANGGGNGQYFKLEIHMDRGAPPIIIDGGVVGGTIGQRAEPVFSEDTPESNEGITQSALLQDQNWDELTGEDLE